jgi:hypothetical protein
MRDQMKRGGGRRRVFRQWLRSWYIWMFQLPLLAPLAWTSGLARAWPDLIRYGERLRLGPRPTQAQDGRNGVALYRANVLRRLRKPQPRYAQVPVQLIVPLRDKYVSPDLFIGIERWVPQLLRRDVDGGHWLPLTHPEWLVRHVRDFIDDVEGRAAASPPTQTDGPANETRA